MPGYGARNEKDGAGDERAGRKRKRVQDSPFGQSGTFQQGQGKDEVLFLQVSLPLSLAEDRGRRQSGRPGKR